MSGAGRRRPRTLVWIVALAGAALWLVLAALAGEGEAAFRGERRGIFVKADGLGLFVGVTSGWPSRAWLARSHLRARGDEGRRRGIEILGLGVGTTVRRWNGNDPILVTRSGVRVPVWLLALLAFSPVIRQLLRRRRLERLRRRRYHRLMHWLRPRCEGCGYDLRASADRCPECGRRIPGPVRLGATRAAEAGRPGNA